MDLQERYQLDVATRVQKVRRKARPWRSIIAAVLAIAGAVVAEISGAKTKGWSHLFESGGNQTQSLLVVVGSAAFLVFGLIAALGISAQVRSGLQPVVGQA
ncbi:MAG TPA: hypothetical protein VFB50_15915, partial [Chloroflexota bacterium]|nr:hypothetical protein [Chloroflexota bacterium]